MKDQKISYKKIIFLFIIGMAFVFASGFAIWGIKEISKGDGTLNFLGYIACILIGLVPTIGAALILCSSFMILKVIFKDKKHPIGNPFIVGLISFFSITVILGFIPILVHLVSFTAGSYLGWLIYDLAIAIILMVVYIISLVKFIIELVREYQKIRTAILETRIIVGNQITNKTMNKKSEQYRF